MESEIKGEWYVESVSSWGGGYHVPSIMPGLPLLTYFKILQAMSTDVDTIASHFFTLLTHTPNPPEEFHSLKFILMITGYYFRFSFSSCQSFAFSLFF